MATANTVADALDSVLNAPKDDAQASNETLSTEVKQALDSVKPKTKAAPSDDKVNADDKNKTVPYDRFSEVVQQKNDAIERLKNLESQFKTASERETTLRQRVGELETDRQIVAAIKDLAQDPRYKDSVIKIDKALQGIHEEVEKAEAKGDDKAVAEATKRFETKAAELEDLLADQNAEGLWNSANQYARALLEALPEEYTNEDRQLLSQLWTPRVNWDYIEENGREVIPGTLQESFAELIKSYGVPRGALVKAAKDEIVKTIPEDAKPRSSEQVVKSILDKDWSETKEGKLVKSDSDFAKDMADLIRATRRGV